MRGFAIQAGLFVLLTGLFVATSHFMPGRMLLSWAIAFVVSFAIYWPLRPKPPAEEIAKGAAAIRKAAEALLADSREYRAAALSEVPDLDHHWYEMTTVVLGRMGYVLLGDFVDVQHNTDYPGSCTVARALRSGDGSETVGIFHLRQRALGWFVRLLTPGRGNLKVIDLTTELSDGVFILTSTSPNNTIQHGPLIMMEHRFGATCEEACSVHRQRVADYRRSHPGVVPVPCFTLEEAFAQSNREIATKARFRRERGLERVAMDAIGSGHPLLATEAKAIKEELSRRQQNDDEPKALS